MGIFGRVLRAIGSWGHLVLDWTLGFSFVVGGQQPVGRGWVMDLHARGSTRRLGAGGAMGSSGFTQERERARTRRQI
jgi:hypothetical protein